MAVRVPRYPKEEFRRRGDAIYEERIKEVLEPEHIGKFVAIDIETGEWETDSDDYQASEKLLQRIPDAQVWLKRAGYDYVHRIGGRSLAGGR